MFRRLLKLLGGRKGGATRGGKGGSHVHKCGKRRSNKAIRTYSNLEGEHCCNDTVYIGIDWASDHVITDEDPDEGDRS